MHQQGFFVFVTSATGPADNVLIHSTCCLEQEPRNQLQKVMMTAVICSSTRKRKPIELYALQRVSSLECVLENFTTRHTAAAQTSNANTSFSQLMLVKGVGWTHGDHVLIHL